MMTYKKVICSEDLFYKFYCSDDLFKKVISGDDLFEKVICDIVYISLFALTTYLKRFSVITY